VSERVLRPTDGAPPPPVTRSLPAVLRELAEGNPSAAEITFGKVVAVPDSKHVSVNIGGSNVIVSRIATYTPTVGEGCLILAGASVLIAIGAIGGATPGTPVAPGTVDGQVLVWNNTTHSWAAASAVPTASNASALGGIAASAYLTHVLAGAHKTWWTHFGPSGLDSNFRITIPHLLGGVPTLILATQEAGVGSVLEGIWAYDASNSVLDWSVATPIAAGWVFAAL